MTISSDFSEVIPSEEIEQMVLDANLATPIAISLAWSRVVGRGRGNNVRIPSRSGLTVPAGTKVENADFSLVSQTTTDVGISGGYVGLADELSSELEHDATVDAVREIIENASAHIQDRADADGLALLATTTNDSDFGANPLTDANILTALAAYVQQNPNKTPAGMGLVLNAVQVRDYGLDLRTNGGGQIGGDAESERVASMLGNRQGFLGVRHGLQTFMSNNVDVTGGIASGAILTLGTGGALAYRLWEPIGVETRRLPRGKKWELTIAARYGWALSKQANIRGIQSNG